MYASQGWDIWVDNYIKSKNDYIQKEDEQKIHTTVRDHSFFNYNVLQIDYPYVIAVLLSKQRNDIVDNI